MKTIILCGGRGTRLNELGLAVPKALVEIGGKPIVWHLLRFFSSQGIDDFILCLGHLGEQIRCYFEERATGRQHLVDRDTFVVDDQGLRCRVTAVDTGPDTNTGGRIKAVERLLDHDDRFLVTYGDGLADIDLDALLGFHDRNKRTATLTAVHPRSGFGVLEIDNDLRVTDFREKPVLKEWINGGFFVFERRIFDYLDSDAVLEREPLAKLAHERELMAYQHVGFWKCMDTYKDNVELNALWETGAPWKLWQDD